LQQQDASERMAMEEKIRVEIGTEITQVLNDLKQQQDAKIQDLVGRETVAIASNQALQQIIGELREQIQECEEEMKRMHARHQQELAVYEKENETSCDRNVRTTSCSHTKCINSKMGRVSDPVVVRNQ
jgi:chromosome segregation ATPase